MEDGKKFFEEGKLEQALASVQQAMERGHQTPDAFSLYGDILFKKEDYEGCIAAVTKCIELDPLCEHAYLLRAQAYIEMKQFEYAEREFENFTKLQEPPANVLMSLGKCKATLNNLDGAAQCFSKIIGNKFFCGIHICCRQVCNL